MGRLGLALAALCVLAGLALATVELRSDVSALFGKHQVSAGALDAPSDRLTIVAIAAPGADQRRDAARAVAEILRADPAVASVVTGPVAPSRGFLEWLWRHRFQLMPPEPQDLEPARMAERLETARIALAGAESLAVADKLLTDPTGSFARLLAALSASSQRLRQVEGAWVSEDGGAALLFVTLADRPFEGREVAAVADAVRRAAEAAGARADLLGPRVISAEVARFTERGSIRSAGIAAVLLLATLGWLLRSGLAVGLVLLPVAIGVAAAVLVVQAVFGSVHAVALGFGGALCGLGLDYPLHLAAQAGPARRRAARLVLIGALTTSAGFLALVGSGVEALMQTGVSVAAGLSGAALAARALARSGSAPARAIPLERLRLGWRHRRALEIACIAAGAAAVLTAPTAQPQALFPLPQHLTAAFERVAAMMDLPSGRYAIEVEGRDLAELLETQRAVIPALEDARAAGAIAGYEMLATVFAGEGDRPALPAPRVFREAAEEALRRAGMKPGFSERQRAAYAEALGAPPMTLASFDAHPELRAIAAGVRLGEDGRLREAVRLFGVTDPAALAAVAGISGARLVDRAAPIEAGLADVRQALILWFAIGGLASMALLAIALRDLRRTAGIALTSAAALGVTAGLASLLAGPIGVFQIVALTLVTGIGIDYGLFLTGPGGARPEPGTARSVALCAASTLIAFGVMAFSDVALLQQIGMTVCFGVIAMLTLNLIQPPEADPEQP